MAMAIIPGPTILKGSNLSASVDSSPAAASLLLAVITPPGWDPAPLTIQWSFDNTTFYDVFDREGRELSFTIIPNSLLIIQSPYTPQTIPFLKFRSGPRSSPIHQSADRVFQLLTQ